MKYSRRSQARMVCLFLCILLLISAFPSVTMATGRQTVRVGFFAFDGYHMQTANGERAGYGYELLQHMAGYTDWQYEYVGYDKSWAQMQDMLANGEIDLLSSAQKTPERLARFDFSDMSVGTSAAILTVKAGNARYALEDHANWSGMRVGMIEDNSRNEDLSLFAAEHDFTYTPVYFHTTDALVEALKSGTQIDAILTSNLRLIDNEWILAQFAPSPFYIMVRKGNTALLSEVNHALESLYNTEPELRTRLMNQYYSPSNGDEIAFTAGERAYIEDMRGSVFTALIDPDAAPYSYWEDGRLTGILYDIAAEIIARCELNIQFAAVQDRAAYAQRMKAGDVDICFDASYSYAQAEAMDHRLTVPYLKVPISRLYRKGSHAFSSGALLKEGDVPVQYQAMLQAQGMTLAYYDTVDEVVDAVLSGKQDMALLNSGAAARISRRDVTNRLLAEEIHGPTAQYAVGVNAERGPVFYSILNKTVASIWDPEIEAISQRYTVQAEDEPFSLIGYTYDYPLHMVAFVATSLLVIGLILLAVHIARERKDEAAKRLEEERRNELLENALATAERADAAKSQFLSRVSHEMRTPLNAIIGFMTLAQDADAQADTQQVRTYLSNSGIAAKQLLSVINDVLDMSAIESGKLKLAQAPFDFRELIHGVTDVYLPLCKQKGLSYETMLLTPTDEWLVGDQLRVNQILMNLLGNAVKFTTAGHVWLKISQYDTSDRETFIHFEISDTGCGMSEEMQARLFKPFEQESATTAQRYGGSGLGLSIVKNLVNMMNGAIRVESVQNKGTAFFVDLPFTKSEVQEDMRLPQPIEHMRVLAVDDDPNERDYLSVVLGRIGVRHTCVADGKSVFVALAAADAAKDSYNICLVDWKMPHMDGAAVTRRIRETYGKDMIVIIASAYEQDQIRQSAAEAGANMFIPKPLFQSTLLDLFMTLHGKYSVSNKAIPARRDFSTKRILLAEDNAMNRLVAEGLIRKLGAICECAEDGQIAVDMFMAARPGYYDAILMDIQMPGMDGFAATKAIRESAHPQAKTIQIIALTANAFNEDIARTLSSGMNAHVAKPIEPDALAAALEKAFAAAPNVV